MRLLTPSHRPICPLSSARPTRRVFGSADHSGADRAKLAVSGRFVSFFSGRESFCKQGLETWIAVQGIKERTDFDESDEGIAAFAKSAVELVDRFSLLAEGKVHDRKTPCSDVSFGCKLLHLSKQLERLVPLPNFRVSLRQPPQHEWIVGQLRRLLVLRDRLGQLPIALQRQTESPTRIVKS